MKPRLIQKIEKEQFELEQTAMAAGLTALELPKENQAEILRYFGWLCFDQILMAENNSEHLRQQNKHHQELYHYALQKGLKAIKPDLSHWDKAGQAMLAVYHNSAHQR